MVTGGCVGCGWEEPVLGGRGRRQWISVVALRPAPAEEALALLTGLPLSFCQEEKSTRILEELLPEPTERSGFIWCKGRLQCMVWCAAQMSFRNEGQSPATGSAAGRQSSAVSPLWELLQRKESDSPKVTPLCRGSPYPVTVNEGAYWPWILPQLGSTLDGCHELTEAVGSLVSGFTSLSTRSCFLSPPSLVLLPLFLWRSRPS